MHLSHTECLREILTGTKTLLLDFDGPICSVFAGFPAPAVAEQLRNILADGGHDHPPADVLTTADPFDIFAYASRLGPSEARYVEAALRAHEVEAVSTAEPTPGAHALIQAWRATGRPLAIVSNNSAAAVEAYLAQHGLLAEVNAIVGRTSANPEDLKPNPHLVRLAITRLKATPSGCTMIGDSISDLLAAKRADIQAIGYANKPGKKEAFSALEPSCIAVSIEDVVETVRKFL